MYNKIQKKNQIRHEYLRLKTKQKFNQHRIYSYSYVELTD